MVASVMDYIQSYSLKLFSDEEALSLFAQHASGKQSFNISRILKLHGEDIVKKCGRLPLALKTLGRVFRTKLNVEEWEELLEREIWDLDNGSEFLPTLMLSYYDLSPHLKQMFVYCCLFPKVYIFDKDELVLLWMAQGFVYLSDRNKSMENFGRGCFEELVSRSFFQHSNRGKSRYAMHDLIHDMVSSVSGEFFLLLGDKMDVYNKHGALEKIHHLSFIHDEYNTYNKYKGLQSARHLRTFLAASVNVSHARKKVPKELVPQQKFLRVLSIANCSVNEVPQSIGSLKHLRYLNFPNTGITCIPEIVGDLHNLQSLLLSDYYALPIGL
ncbi:putative P-loop containing nucleoside triphosphate hydrolase, leucine-rich repeat domain superfamily [Helianthus anomalus]